MWSQLQNDRRKLSAAGIDMLGGESGQEVAEGTEAACLS